LIYDLPGFTAGALQTLGLEKLKVELQSRGLKCGGTLQERAARGYIYNPNGSQAFRGSKMRNLVSIIICQDFSE